MYLGIFVLLAGLLSLLENINVINTDIKWGIPLAVICIGASIIHDHFKNKG